MNYGRSKLGFKFIPVEEKIEVVSKIIAG